MEGSKYSSKKSLQGGVFDSVVTQAYNKYLNQIKSERMPQERSNVQFKQLSMIKKTQRQARQLFSPPNIQLKNGDRSIKQSKQVGRLKLPQITKLKWEEGKNQQILKKNGSKQNNLYTIAAQSDNKAVQHNKSIGEQRMLLKLKPKKIR